MGFEVTRIGTRFGNAYLLTGERVALVDTLHPRGYGKLESLLGKKGMAVKDVELILLTHHHFDHAGNAARIKELSGATLVAGLDDAPVIDGTRETPPPSNINRLGRMLTVLPGSWLRKYQDFPRVDVDRKVTAGEMIEELGLEVIGLPGHTAGGVGYLDREGRRAFTGDMVSYFWGMPGMPALSASEGLREIFESQELLAGLDLDIAYPGHGLVIEPDASKVISAFTGRKKSKKL